MIGASSLPVRRDGGRSAILEHLVALVFALTVAGYPIAGLLSAGFSLPSEAASMPFRALVDGLAVLLTVLTLRSGRMRWPALLLLGLLICYLLRVTWDAHIQGIERADTILIFFIAVVLIPCFSLMVGARVWSDDIAAKWMLIIGGIVSVSALMLDWSGLATSHSLTQATGRLSTDTVNPITLGHVAVSALLAIYCLLSVQMQIKKKCALVAVAVICLVCLAKTGSKGPLVSVMVAVFFLVAIGRVPWTSFFLLVCLGAVVFGVYGESIIDRFLTIEQDESTAIRIELTRDALEQIASMPWYGSAFLELKSQKYPHNLVIEAMMALGIPLGILFLALCFYGVFRVFQLQRQRTKTTFLALIFIQYFVAGFFSGSLYGSASLWCALALLCNFPKLGRINEYRMQEGSIQSSPARIG
ncbi:MAG: O-antigen ligase family protein [Pseudomonadota bacterium]